MKSYLFLIFTIILFISCGNENNDIYKTKSGEYASVSGNFIAKFPTKPEYSVIDNQLGLDKFQLHLIRSNLGPNKVFSIEYNDYPEHMIKSVTNEQLFSQAVDNFSNKVEEAFQLEFQQPIKQHELKGRYFVLKLKQHAIDLGVKGHIEGKLVRDGNRVYTVTYIGKNDKNTDLFMNSFRLIK